MPRGLRMYTKSFTLAVFRNTCYLTIQVPPLETDRDLVGSDAGPLIAENANSGNCWA